MANNVRKCISAEKETEENTLQIYHSVGYSASSEDQVSKKFLNRCVYSSIIQQPVESILLLIELLLVIVNRGESIFLAVILPK